MLQDVSTGKDEVERTVASMGLYRNRMSQDWTSNMLSNTCVLCGVIQTSSLKNFQLLKGLSW